MLKDEPGFDKDHWPSMADSRWGESLHTYYNRDPYWVSRRDYVDPDVPPTAH
jgi:predicted P-loop ATPase